PPGGRRSRQGRAALRAAGYPALGLCDASLARGRPGRRDGAAVALRGHPPRRRQATPGPTRAATDPPRLAPTGPRPRAGRRFGRAGPGSMEPARQAAGDQENTMSNHHALTSTAFLPFANPVLHDPIAPVAFRALLGRSLRVRWEGHAALFSGLARFNRE